MTAAHVVVDWTKPGPCLGCGRFGGYARMCRDCAPFWRACSGPDPSCSPEPDGNGGYRECCQIDAWYVMHGVAPEDAR